MKKLAGILALGLLAAGFLILIGTGTPERTYAEETEHIHCICGGTGEDTAPEHATADNGHNVHVFTQTWEAWSDGAALPKGTAGEVKYYYLTTDVEISGQVNITSGATVNLCLNGHSVEVAEGKNTRTLILQGNASAAAKKLVVTNCKEKADGRILGRFNGTQAGVLWVTNNSGNEMTLFNVTVDATNCVSTKTGGGAVMIAEGTFRAYDSDFIGGTANATGGSSYGGGTILASGGSAEFSLYGCTLTGGTAPGSNGGGISLTGSASGTLKDCTISGGDAKIGGNVYISGASLTIDGGTVISGGKATKDSSGGGHGGNIYFGNGSLTINGGTVTGGSITNIGGNNISSNGDGTLTVNGGTIDGGIRLWNNESAKLTVNGGTINTDSEGGISILAGSVTVSGKPVIRKIQLDPGKVITVGTLEEGAGISVLLTDGEGTVSTGLSSDPSGYFDSYDGRYALSYADGTLSLIAAVHTHCVCAGADESHAHTETQVWEPWTDTASLPKTGGYYFLVGDVTLSGGTNPGDGQAVYLCLAGHSITQSKAGQRVLQTNLTSGQTGNKKYVFTNCKAREDGRIIGKWTGSSATQGGVLWGHGNSTNEIDTYNVIVDGSISESSSRGGAVSVESGSVFKAWKTVFIGGTAKYGGAAAVVNGTFDAVDCEFIGGTATENGGVLYVDASGALTLTGCSVSGGTAAASGGGLFLLANGSAELTDTDIYGNSAENGGNIRADGTLVMTGGSVKDGHTTSNGINIRVGGTAELGGDIEVSGGQAASGGNNICVTSSGELTIKGGTYGFVQAVDGASVVNVEGGTCSSVGLYNGTFNISGGVIQEALASGWVGHDSQGKMFITGGHIGKVTKTGSDPTTLLISGGYFGTAPDTAYLSEGCYLFDYDETLNGVRYVKEAAPGAVVEATSRAATGFMPAAAVSGGGLVKKDAAFTLTAPAVEQYTFLGWYEGGTSLGTAETYTGTAASSRTIEALYEYGAADGFLVTVGGLDTGDYTVSGTAVGSKFRAGTEVTVTYTGSGAFDGWVNDSGKLVSRDAEYRFTLSGNTKLTASAGSETAALVVFYTMNYQILKTRTIGGADALTDADLLTVPEVKGKTNGRWILSGQAVSTASEVEALSSGKNPVNVVASYDNDGSATYTVTVKGVEKGASGTPDIWTAYAAGDQTIADLNVSETAELNAPSGGKAFLYYADKTGSVLSASAKTMIRYQTDTTIYAVYGDAAGTAAEPAVVMITAEKDGSGTVYFEALRDVPESFTLKEQGILFSTEAGIVYGKTGVYRYVSNGKEDHDVTGLTIKNAPLPVYARGYVIYTDGEREGIVYSEEAKAE